MTENTTLFSTYVDWTKEPIPRPFYVGKGNVCRVRTLNKRNRKHTHVSAKHGIRREIVLETTDENAAFAREIELVAELHTFVDDPLCTIGCNLTPGGEGHVPSEAMKKELSARAKRRWADPEMRKVWQSSQTGNTTPRTEEWKKAHSQKMSGVNHPMFGKTLSAETKARMSAIRKGRIPWNKGLHPENPKKRKPLIVTTPEGEAIRFDAQKFAAAFLTEKTGRALNSTKGMLMEKLTNIHGFTIEYLGAKIENRDSRKEVQTQTPEGSTES